MPAYSYHKKRKPAARLFRYKHVPAVKPRGRHRAGSPSAHSRKLARASRQNLPSAIILRPRAPHAGTAKHARFFARYFTLFLLLLATPLAHQILPPESSPLVFHLPGASSSVPAPNQAEGLQQSLPPANKQESEILLSTEVEAFHSALRQAARTPELSLPFAHAHADPLELQHPGVHWQRFALVQTLTLGIGGYGFQYYNNLFGRVGQPFKIGNDWNKDHTLHFDELLHFQGGYRITQAVSAVYRWAGVPHKTADWIGLATSAGIMTSLEYIDGRRKNDQASYSDLAANFLGMGFALARARYSWLQDFDLRMSYRTLADPFRRSTVKRYDRITHWLTYDLNRRWKIPLHLGLGYSVVNARRPGVQAQYYIGVGISPVAVLDKIFPAAARPLAWLDFYHFGNQVVLNHVPVVSKKGKRKS